MGVKILNSAPGATRPRYVTGRGLYSHDRSDIEVGVLIASTGHGPSPPEGGTFRHRSGATQATPLLYHQGSENQFTYPITSHQHTRGALQ
ncbi:hypothetical protein AVEN_245490-1 [Araneus ventricosus]|uniref:Uncharacterized protein n=1 Tax=Araneus ventricosus TaxID=182803 RepID=A0A4Y2D940_ARAVE|nr:hypothetical protein AVEN_245490-1 [Araneus ventricosus]